MLQIFKLSKKYFRLMFNFSRYPSLILLASFSETWYGHSLEINMVNYSQISSHYITYCISKSFDSRALEANMSLGHDCLQICANK